MRTISISILFTFLISFVSEAKNYYGIVLDIKTGKKVEYVNIGIVGKNIGTVANENGKYKIELESKFDNDTLKFSCIGYKPFSIRISEFKRLSNYDIFLEEKITEMQEVRIFPKIFKQKILGVTTKKKMMQAGFDTVKLGYEVGILMKIKKSAILQKVNINIATCTFDSIFYRLNIYKVTGKLQFENILKNPIYVQLPKYQTFDKIEIDLKKYNLEVQGSVLITLENIKDLGPGKLFFCVGLSDRSYYRKTSQAKWESVPIGVSISLDALVEK